MNYKIFAAATLGLVLAACGRTQSDSSGDTPTTTAPSVVSPPTDQTVNVGQTATFSVTVTGSDPLTYQWLKSGTAIASATASSYTTPATVAGDDGSVFTVTISNSAGSVTSSGAMLSVAAATAPSSSAPAITSQPAAQSVTAGQTATFSVTASGTAPLTYQWSKGGTAISGATGASYTTPATTTADSGSLFTVAVSNATGSVTSASAKLTVTAASSNATAPSITTQPAAKSVTAGQTATFTVAASGTTPLSYQWSKGSTAISGATGASYTTPATTTADNGSLFTVKVSNAAGSVTSASAQLTVTASAPTGSVDVATYKNDNSRSGLNAAETVLTTSNVISSKFGKLRSLGVDGKVDAQPLVVSQLSVGGTTRNVVFVATEHASVYAFDTDTGTELWKASLLASGETTSDQRGCTQIIPEIGITATPVIDRGAGPHGTMYVVAMSKDGSGNYHQRLHALDLSTGLDVATATPIGAMVTTQGGGTNTFEPGAYEARSALTLVNGSLIIAFTSHCDIQPYSGWVMAYSPSSLGRTGVLNVGPNSNVGPAIWMSGGGPAADSSGNLYLLTANGAFETTLDANGFPNKGDYGNSFVKISTSGGDLELTDYFAVTDTVAASAADRDLGSGSAMLLPDLKDAGGTTRQLVVGAGKDARMYIVDRTNMGKFSASTNKIYGSVPLAAGIFSSPAWFNNMVFFGPINSHVQQYKFASGSFTLGAQTTTNFAYPGSAIAVSANGTAEGIVWAHENATIAVLHAYKASDLTEIYNSNQATGSRDHFGTGNKFITPTIANGKVFVGTTNSVAVFGLLN